jgi:hypothetical protein
MIWNTPTIVLHRPQAGEIGGDCFWPLIHVALLVQSLDGHSAGDLT